MSAVEVWCENGFCFQHTMTCASQLITELDFYPGLFQRNSVIFSYYCYLFQYVKAGTEIMK